MAEERFEDNDDFVQDHEGDDDEEYAKAEEVIAVSEIVSDLIKQSFQQKKNK